MEKVLQQYLFGGIATFILGYLLFNGLLGKDDKKKKKYDSSLEVADAKVVEQGGKGSSKSTCNDDADIIIVGAGVAGSALACVLGMDGRRVHVIERNLTQPDRIVGEFLQPGGYLKLIELGLGECVEEIDAQQMFGYAIYKDGRVTKVSYPLENFKLNVSARSFHNGRFIQRMREKAAKLSNVLLEQGTVISLLEENGIIKGVKYKTKLGKELNSYAPLTIVCDGCFSNLRRFLCSPKVEVLSCFVGLILENCKVPHSNYGHIILGGPSIILIYQISSNEVRCLIDIHGTVPSIANGEMAEYLKSLVAPQIPDELRASFVSAVDKGNIRTMPNMRMATSPSARQGALLLGDALNIRHPLAGGGMTVALSDIIILRDLLKPLDDLRDSLSLRKQLNLFYLKRKPTACVLNAIASIAYQLFSHSLDQGKNVLVQASLYYLALGDENSKESMALLSGIGIGPLAILLHVARICIYTTRHLLLPFPSPNKLWKGAKMTLAVWAIIFPIMKQDGAWDIFFPPIVHSYCQCCYH